MITITLEIDEGKYTINIEGKGDTIAQTINDLQDAYKEIEREIEMAMQTY